MNGLQIGLLNVAEDMRGLRVGGYNNADYFMGLEFVVVDNVASDADAIQVAFGRNIVEKDLRGFQLSLFGYNRVGNSMSGIQFAPFNRAEGVQGIQIGFVNQCESLRGIQIGAINLVKERRFPTMPIINIGF